MDQGIYDDYDMIQLFYSVVCIQRSIFHEEHPSKIYDRL